MCVQLPNSQREPQAYKHNLFVQHNKVVLFYYACLNALLRVYMYDEAVIIPALLYTIFTVSIITCKLFINKILEELQ